jgi:hypothetical protein
MFGGSITFDEITFSMLIDTACILTDGIFAFYFTSYALTNDT